MFVDVKGFLRGVQTLSTWTVKSIGLFTYQMLHLLYKWGKPDAEISRGRKILPDPHLFYFLSINFPPAFFFTETVMNAQIFSKNELHLFCSTYPTIIRFPIDVRKNKPYNSCLAWFVYVATVSRNTVWMILVLKQSVLSLWYSYGWFLSDQ